MSGTELSQDELDAITIMLTFNPNMAPGDAIGERNITAVATRNRYNIKSINKGFVGLQERGYVEGERANDGGVQMKLTQLGFDEGFA